MSNLITQAIGDLLSANDILADDTVLPSIWDNFSSAFAYTQKDENDEQLQLILSSIKTNIIDVLVVDMNDVCDRLSSIIYDILDDMSKANIPDNMLVVFLQGLMISLRDYASSGETLFVNKHINMSDKDNILSAIDKSSILSILVAHGIVPVDGLDSFLDKQSTSLKTLARSIIVDSRQLGDPFRDNSTRGVKIQPLSLKDFGTDLDKIIYCATRFIMTGKNYLPDSLSELNDLVFPMSEFAMDKLFRRGCYAVNKTNYMVLTALQQYISDSYEMIWTDVCWLFQKKQKELKSIMKKIPYLVSVNLAYVVLTMVLLRTLLINGDKDSYRSALTKNQHGMLAQINIIKDVKQIKQNAEMELFGNLSHTDHCVELRSFISGRESDGFPVGKWSVHSGPSLIPDTIQSIYDEISCVHSSDLVRHVDDSIRNIGKSEDTGALSSLLSVERASDKNIFINLASTLHKSLNESLLSGDIQQVPFIIEAMQSVRNEYSGLLETMSTSDSEVSSALEMMNIDCCTYSALAHDKKYDTALVKERSEILLENIKKTIPN